MVDSEGSTTTASFFYGTSPTLATSRKTPGQSIGDGSGLVAVSTTLTGLGTRHHLLFRGRRRQRRRDDRRLDPLLHHGDPQSARLDHSGGHVRLDLRRHAKRQRQPRREHDHDVVYLRHRTEPEHGRDDHRRTTEAGDGRSPVSASAALTGLLPGTTYYFRVVASSARRVSGGYDSSASTRSIRPRPPPPRRRPPRRLRPRPARRRRTHRVIRIGHTASRTRTGRHIRTSRRASAAASEQAARAPAAASEQAATAPRATSSPHVSGPVSDTIARHNPSGIERIGQSDLARVKLHRGPQRAGFIDGTFAGSLDGDIHPGLGMDRTWPMPSPLT